MWSVALYKGSDNYIYSVEEGLRASRLYSLKINDKEDNPDEAEFALEFSMDILDASFVLHHVFTLRFYITSRATLVLVWGLVLG